MNMKKRLRQIFQPALFLLVYLLSSFISFTGAKQLSAVLHTPLVSVLIPVYNREKLVNQALDSILNQTFKDYELIVVDDGSTDATPFILEAYAKQDKRIKVITLPYNQGVSNARNTAQNAARGKYLLLLDSDDLLYPRAVEKLVRAMEENPSFDILNAKELYIKGFPALTLDSKKYTLQENGVFPVCMFFANCYVNSGVIVRRDFIVKNNIQYKTKYTIGEDYDYWLQCIFAGAKMGTLDDYLTVIRYGHASLIRDEKKRTVIDTIEIKKDIQNHFQSSFPAQMAYNLYERCVLLKEFINFNQTNHIVDQQTMQDYYQWKCSQNDGKKFVFKHPAWTDRLFFKSDKRICRIEGDECASYQKKGNAIFLHWEFWQSTEKFVYDENEKAYIFTNK